MTTLQTPCPRPDGDTRIFLTIGDPISQVKSPAMLSAILARRGVNALVVPAHITAADLGPFIASVRRMRNLDGIVVTVPHKITAIGHCDTLTPRATFIGATNVMRRLPDGHWHGDNLDGVGCLAALEKEGFDPAGASVLLVGAGGAGSAIAIELLDCGTHRLAIHDAETERRDVLVSRLSEHYPGRVHAGSPSPVGFDFVINATPVGMKEDDGYPVDASALLPSQFIVDIITKPAVSRLIVHARSLACRTMTGMAMLEAQAERLVDHLLGTDHAAG
jgi:shikimate dehydrogenase